MRRRFAAASRADVNSGRKAAQLQKLKFVNQSYER
jgi:hypothetical protein